MLHVINKPKSTYYAFNATDTTFDDEAFSKAEDSRQMTTKQEKQKKKIKKPESRNYRQNRNKSHLPASKNLITANQTVKKHYGPCQAYDRSLHIF